MVVRAFVCDPTTNRSPRRRYKPTINPNRVRHATKSDLTHYCICICFIQPCFHSKRQYSSRRRPDLRHCRRWRSQLQRNSFRRPAGRRIALESASTGDPLERGSRVQRLWTGMPASALSCRVYGLLAAAKTERGLSSPQSEMDMNKRITSVFITSLLACLAVTATAQDKPPEKKIKTGLWPADWTYKLAEGVTTREV